MSNPAVITLTYKGTDLQAFPRIFLWITEGKPGASPEVRGDNRRTPYRRGQVYAAKRADRFVCSLSGWISGNGSDEAAQRADTADARETLAALFDVEGGVGDLVAVTENGTTWTLSCYPEVFIPEADPAIPTHETLSVRLIAIDPPEWT